MERSYSSQPVYTHIYQTLRQTPHTPRRNTRTVVDQGVGTTLSNAFSSFYVFKFQTKKLFGI